MRQRVRLVKARNMGEIRVGLQRELESYRELLPASKDSLILLKPNLNSYMNALTGNTTDLRILAVLIEYLQERGYRRILIGEGTSSGFYRTGIDVMGRLMVRALARKYQVETLDFNQAPYQEISFEGGVKARVARICLEADLFINLPKLKTHFETGLSACLKNMMGCLVGLPEKQKTHRSLGKNILNLNRHLKPHLHIVDGLVAMEGNGPSAGTPVGLGVIVLGTDPYLVDLACARLAQMDFRKVRYLKEAQRQGLLRQEHHALAKALPLNGHSRKFREPQVNPFVALVNHPRWQHYIVRVRLLPFFDRLFATSWGGRFLEATGLRQDVFMIQDAHCQGLKARAEACAPCQERLCLDFCPAGLTEPAAIGDEVAGCFHCLYCYLVCPQRAIEFQGELGFLKVQLERYDDLTRHVCRELATSAPTQATGGKDVHP